MQIHCTCHTKYRKSIKQLRHSHFLNPAVESIGWQTPSRMQMYCTCHTKYKKSMASLFHSHLSRRAADSSWERLVGAVDGPKALIFHYKNQWSRLIRVVAEAAGVDPPGLDVGDLAIWDSIRGPERALRGGSGGCPTPSDRPSPRSPRSDWPEQKTPWARLEGPVERRGTAGDPLAW